MGWFHELTGLSSDIPAVVRAGCHVDGNELVFPGSGKRLVWGSLSMPMLSDLPLPPQGPPKGPPRLRLREVVADVARLHADPDNAGAVFQVASQFNLLEMVGPSVTPDQGIAGYAFDHTQGPACAMACAAGTIYRNYLVPFGGQNEGGQIGQSAAKQLDMLADLGAVLGNETGDLWQMRNGYALPQSGGLQKVAQRIAAGDRATLRGRVRVGVQGDTQVTLPGAKHVVTQIYASALPIAYAEAAVADWEPFARLVLEAAYLATLAAAVQSGASRVFLTRLGEIGRAHV